jgi:hypothetical protein
MNTDGKAEGGNKIRRGDQIFNRKWTQIEETRGVDENPIHVVMRDPITLTDPFTRH